ncbi:MAG: hypothetical protein JWQ39_2587 [Glaciihabitans sp.]|jgi:hypothetical protein|nr:hypothetical protein [Glaciihabitans sp.]
MFRKARKTVDRFLTTNPADVGCDETRAHLHEYVDRMLRHRDAAKRYPGIAAHLVGCDPCSDDYAGLLAAAS